MSKLSSCIDRKMIFHEQSSAIGIPHTETAFRIVDYPEIKHPLLSIKTAGVYCPITYELETKYEEYIKTIKWLLVVTQLGALRLIPVNLSSNDSWSKSKKELFDIGYDPIRAARNKESECYEFIKADDIQINEPSKEQIEKFIENTLEKLILTPENINDYIPLFSQTRKNEEDKKNDNAPTTITEPNSGVEPNINNANKKKENEHIDIDNIFSIDINNLDAAINLD